MNSGTAHDLLGHCNHRSTKEVVVVLGWVVTGDENDPCIYFTTAKAKQNTLDRTRNSKARESNERIGIDISTIKSPRKSEIIVSKPNWLMVVDEMSGVKISSFHKNKDDIIDMYCTTTKVK